MTLCNPNKLQASVYSIVLLIITVLFVVESLPFNSVLLIFSVRIFNPYFCLSKLCGNIRVIVQILLKTCNLKDVCIWIQSALYEVD